MTSPNLNLSLHNHRGDRRQTAQDILLFPVAIKRQTTQRSSFRQNRCFLWSTGFHRLWPSSLAVCTDLLLITGLISHCCVLVAYLDCPPWSASSVYHFIFWCTKPQQLRCRASLAWELFDLCLCSQAIAPRTGRASCWVLSSSYWFHGTLVCLLHQLTAHQLCTAEFGVDWLPDWVLVLISLAFLPHSPQTASPVQGRLQRRPAARCSVGPWGPTGHWKAAPPGLDA